MMESADDDNTNTPNTYIMFIQGEKNREEVATYGWLEIFMSATNIGVWGLHTYARLMNALSANWVTCDHANIQLREVKTFHTSV